MGTRFWLYIIVLFALAGGNVSGPRLGTSVPNYLTCTCVRNQHPLDGVLFCRSHIIVLRCKGRSPPTVGPVERASVCSRPKGTVFTVVCGVEETYSSTHS